MAATTLVHAETFFSDSFDRPDSTDLDAIINGMGGSLITNGTLTAGSVWL
jgi:hypothetical protein